MGYIVLYEKSTSRRSGLIYESSELLTNQREEQEEQRCRSYQREYERKRRCQKHGKHAASHCVGRIVASRVYSYVKG